jgi:hypothetical protein
MHRTPERIEEFRRSDVQAKSGFFSSDVRHAQIHGYREVLKVVFGDNTFSLDDARSSAAYNELLRMIRNAGMEPFIYRSGRNAWIAMRRPDFPEPAPKYTNAQIREMNRPSGVGGEIVKTFLILFCTVGAFGFGILALANMMYPDSPAQEQSR